MQKWKVLKEEDVSPSKWFPIKKHSVELGNGKIIDDYFISPMGSVVMVLPITKKGEVVLVKQYKHGLGEIVIELPAGFQQECKTLEESAVAELEEEAGIRTDVKNLISLGKNANNPTKIFSVVHGYLAKDLEFNSIQQLDGNEEIEILMVPAKRAIEMAMNGEIWVGDSIIYLLKAFYKYPELFR